MTMGSTTMNGLIKFKAQAIEGQEINNSKSMKMLLQLKILINQTNNGSDTPIAPGLVDGDMVQCIPIR